VALAAIGEARADAEKATRLFALITREMVPYVPENSFAWPDDLLIRGYGSCDQMAWALCSLAEQVGLHSAIVFLRRPDVEASHHTIAALRLDGRWRPCDPFQALDFGGPDAAPDLLAALEEPAALRRALPGTPGEVLLKPEEWKSRPTVGKAKLRENPEETVKK